MSGSSNARMRRKGVLAPSPDRIAIPDIPHKGIGRREIGWAAAFLAAWTGLFSLSVVLKDAIPLDEFVTIIDVEEPPPPPPPPPPKEEPPKPKDLEPPKPVPPDPDQPPPPPSAEPPQPQFGLPEDATSANGGFAVATGNSLMTHADTVVKKPPPAALQAAPPIQSSYDAMVVDDVMPAYPEWALEQGVQAVVEVMVTLDEKGKVSDIQFLRSGGKDFDESVRRSLRTTRFKPLIDLGKPVPCRFRKKYNFEI